MARRGRTASGPEEAAPDRCRLDKWIWCARFHRARETCADLVRRGHVRLNGARVKQPGTFVKVGDIVTLALPGQTIVVEILDLAERRGDPVAGAALYRAVEPVSPQSKKND